MSCRCFVLLAAVLLTCSAVSAQAMPIMLFDEAHGQRFLIGEDGPLHLSALAGFFQDQGFEVRRQAEALTSESLSGVAILVISGPFQPLQESEVDAVVDFISKGGGLAVMLHVAPPLRNLLDRLETDFTNGTVREMRQIPRGDPLVFPIVRFAAHPVTSGLKGFTVYGSWALRGTAPQTQIVAVTSKHAWVDLDHDNRLTKADPVQQFGVMVAGELGGGRYVVLGDDAVFQNRFFDAANRQLALQMAAWLAAAKTP